MVPRVLPFTSRPLRPTTPNCAPTLNGLPLSPASSSPLPLRHTNVVALAQELAQLDPEAAAVVEAMLESLLRELRVGRP